MTEEHDEKPESPLVVAKPSGDAGMTEAAVFATAASAVLGFPIPPSIAHNVISSVGALVAATVGVPIAYLESWSQRVRAETAARESFVKLAVPIAAKALSDNKEMTDRAMGFLGHRLLREQRARETITQGALEDLKADPPKVDAPAVIDEDWLHMFARHAETKTNADVQAYFSRVLAGEIRKPGSFSPETIEVLSRMMPGVGRLFQGFCSIATELFDPSNPIGGIHEAWVIQEPFGSAGDNALAPVGFPYDTICRLQDAGLVRSDLHAYITLPPIVFCIARIGGRPLNVRATGTPETSPELGKPHRFKVIRFTAAGTELRRIVHMTPNEVYVSKFIEWVKTLGLVQVPGTDIPPSRPGE